jgi:hypothetical protein
VAFKISFGLAKETSYLVSTSYNESNKCVFQPHKSNSVKIKNQN